MAGWPSEEEKWAFWARLIHHYCGQYQPTPVMNDLKAIVGEKDYFVVTSNGEGPLELCGFDPTKIYEIEGNWFTMQCARPCHDTLYSGLEVAENYRLPNRAAMCLQSWCRAVPSAEVPWTSTWARVRE